MEINTLEKEWCIPNIFSIQLLCFKIRFNNNFGGSFQNISIPMECKDMLVQDPISVLFESWTQKENHRKEKEDAENI